MPRLFTALEIPEDVGFRLSLVQGGLPGARWIDRENYHITLRFIGDVDGNVAGEVAAALDTIDAAPLTIALEGMDAFGSKKPRSVFAAVARNPALFALQADQERVMQRIGLPPERRKYTPHVTIARLRGAGQQEVAHWLASHGGFRSGSFEANRFVLYSSRASTGGGPYVVEHAYPLG